MSHRNGNTPDPVWGSPEIAALMSKAPAPDITVEAGNAFRAQELLRMAWWALDEKMPPHYGGRPAKVVRTEVRRKIRVFLDSRPKETL